MSPHQKHAKLTKPKLGTFASNEWAIIGTPSENIQELTTKIVAQLSPKYNIGYVDADDKAVAPKDSYTLEAGSLMHYTDKINFHRFDLKASLNSYQYRVLFNNMDAVIVNGNHFKAQKQIVVIDPQNKASLQRELDRLTNVVAIVLKEEKESIYPFLVDYINNIKSIPVFKWSEAEQLGAHLKEELEQAVPPIYGLVLAGGKSSRMGTDKGAIAYHGKPQREYAAELLAGFCEKTFISHRSEQEGQIDTNFPLLKDTFEDLGPFGAILSAFRSDPNKAWLVVAVDLPLLDQATLQELSSKRNPSKVATAFQSPINELPEPLITIWEPKSYPILLQFLAQGYSCARKPLINAPIELIQAPNAQALMNVNTPEEKLEAVTKIERFPAGRFKR